MNYFIFVYNYKPSMFFEVSILNYEYWDSPDLKFQSILPAVATVLLF